MDFIATRPIAAELEAVNRALVYAKQTGCKLHFVHISSAEAVQVITEAKARGTRRHGGNVPALLGAHERRCGAARARCKVCAADSHVGRSSSLVGRAGRLGSWISSLLTTLHRRTHMKQGDFFAAWGGISGAQSSLELMLDEGHLRREIPLPEIARMLASRASQALRAYIRAKGK